ncbi:hypothetical protein BH24ACI5_BH24ACI5_19370 [soil metagenome]
MRMRSWRSVALGGFLAVSLMWPVLAAPQQAPPTQQTPPAPQPAPTELRSLLASPQSEMRLVVQRYTMDRNTLNGNYLAGGRDGGRGGGGAQPATAPATPPNTSVSLSPNRIARLKRFDLDWQAALEKIETGRLTAAAQSDLATLRETISANLKQLDADALAVAEVMPLVPFALEITSVIEHRIRMGDMDGRKAAASIDAVAKQIAQVRQKLQDGLASGGPATAMRASRELATRAADSVDALRANVTEWFNHYNGYDPLFTWWVTLPHSQADKVLVEYAAFLRGPVAAAGLQTTNADPVGGVIAPAPAPKFSSVPELAEIIALPQDEMAPVVQRFLGRGAGGRGGGPAADREPAYYQGWLAALKTLDFDRLSRNAQVDYLFIKRRAELALSRANAVPQQDIPRKTDDSGITGAARGRDGLIRDLADEMIPYTPEQLIALGEREYAWTVAEMIKASTEMGFGTDWKQAVEKVKNMHVEPGRQPEMVRDLLFDAIDYLRTHDLITVPAVASESLRMTMMSPERQLTAPFFLGGSQIIVSYPTSTMDYDTRIQSMRGNNIYFSTAVAHHEMIPGHNLVGYMGQRFNGYRAGLGGTPFLGEGWPLYWETILYDKGFFDSPEKRVGSLFWRMHRAARIVFSLKFHMGQWSPQECIDFLVEEVGHERDNATAEVRRSFVGGYGPLYQAAYLLGGLQIRGMRREIVDSGQRTEKDFHDEIMRQGSMPVAFLRLAVSKQKLTRDMVVDWKFYGDLPDGTRD